MSQADDLCKQADDFCKLFGSWSGPTVCIRTDVHQANLGPIHLIVFLEEFSKKVDVEKKSADDNKNMKSYPVSKTLHLMCLTLKVSFTTAADDKF